MQIPQIRMQSEMAQIAIHTTPTRQTIRQSNAEMQIEQPRAGMTMRTIPGKLTIDQTQAREEMDIKSISKRVRENAIRASQKLLEGIARVSSEGDEMLDIHTGRDVLVEQAARKANPPPAETNITWIPSPFSVKINYQPGGTDIQVQPREPRIDVNIRKPMIAYERGKVDIALKQRNSLQIDFVK